MKISKNETPVIYISGSITNGGEDTRRRSMKKHVMQAIGIGITLLKMGYAPYIPHLDYLFGWHSRGKTVTWEEFLNWDLAVIKKCDGIYRIRGKSKGADIECRFAKRHRKPVFYSIKKIDKYYGRKND